MTQLQSHTLLPYDIGDRPVPGYTLRRYLGGGAIGHVWLAETDSGFQQAIKVVDLRDAGGRKEFRGLRTVKQRRLLSGNLLTLIDYWLKDAEGNVMPDLDEEADSFFGNTPKPQPASSPLAATQSRTLDKTGGSPAKSQPSTSAKLAPGQPSKPLTKGTLVSSDDDLSCAPTLTAPPILQPAKAPASNKKPPVQLIVAMELGHKTLFDRMKECRSDGEGPGIPLEELLPYMEHAARGLDYLHREGILHRDVKPHNIMLVGDVAKVCDYGLVVADDYDLSKTSKAYTPYYASPEAVANKALTGRTDQYSLAVAYVEVRAGQLPYSSETAAAVYAAKETGNYELKGIGNPHVRKVLKKALAKEPKERYTTCVEFIKDLARAERTRPKASGMGRKLVAAVVVLLLAALGGALAYEPSRTYLLGLVHQQSRPDDPGTRPDEPKPGPQPGDDKPPVEPANPQEPEPNPARSGIDAPPKTSKKPESPPAKTAETQRALERLNERVARYSADDAPADERAEAELFAFLDAAVREGATPAELSAARTRLAGLSFAKYLADDAALADPVLRTEVLRRAALLGGQERLPGQTPPLVALVQAETELENAQASGAPGLAVNELRPALQNAVSLLEKTTDSANASLLAYGRFVLARFNAAASAAPNPADLSANEKILLDWPVPAGASTGDWRTPRRTRQAAELLTRLGEGAFALTDADIVRFHALPEDASGKAADYLDKARNLGATTPQVLGLLSIARALGPRMTEQPDLARAVADASARALASDDVRASLAQNQREHLVAYVGALATARLKNSDNAQANRAAIAWFAGKLEDATVFVEASRGERDDAGVLENIVLPALAIPVADSPASEVRQPLAVIWAALGRLIERNPSFVEIPGVPRETHPDTDTAALLTAHRAYGQARQLDDRERYASGFGRTLLKLPRDVFEQQNGIDLLKQVMPAGQTQDQGLLLVAARLLRREAQHAGSRAEKLKLFDDSLGRYAKLLAQTAINDPFALASLAQVSASATHLEAAFFTSIESADEARRAAGAAAPVADLTKFDHLQRAVEFAAAAKLDQARQLPEEAFIAEGNAHEDLAHYYKLVSHYPEAIAAFEQATRESGVVRSSIYAWTCKGRAEFRAAVDAADIAGDLEKRQELFRQAFVSLTRAVAEGKQDEPRYIAEAHWWLGQVLFASVLYGPGDLSVPASSPLAAKSFGELKQMLALKASQEAAANELRSRLKVWETSVEHFQRAAQTAEAGWKSDWPLVLRDGMQTRLDLAEQLRTLADYAQLDRGAILEGIAADAQKVLDLAQQQPEAVGAANTLSAVAFLAAARKELPTSAPAGPKAALDVLRQGESLFKAQGDAWRAQRVELILLQAQHYEKAQLAAAEKEVERAEEVARAIEDAQLSLQARGNCARVHADVIFQARVGDFGNPKLDRQVFLSLEQAQKLYVQAEASLASADDARTEPNMALLRRQNFVSLENNRFKPELTELEVYRLRKFIARTRPLRIQASTILAVLLRDELAPQHMNTKFSNSRAPHARHFRELLTPVAYLGKYIPPDLRTILQRVDHKLGL